MRSNSGAMQAVATAVLGVVLGLGIYGVAHAEPGDTRGSKPLKESLARARGQKPPVVSGKIMQGADADWARNKWQVALLRSEEPNNASAQFCGGSLIAENWVLTAGHCVDGGTLPGDVEVLSGTASLTTGGQRVKVAKIFVHGGYAPAVDDPFKPPRFDIALLRLAANGTGEPIKPISAAEEPSFIVSQLEATVTGWGLTETGHVSTKLKGTSVPMQAFAKCNGPASYDKLLQAEMFCAGRDAGGPDSCSGDSGGPITRQGRLLGVVSWGTCGQSFKYGVYTNAAKVAAWISKCVADEASCGAN